MKSLFRTKSIESIIKNAEKTHFKKTLGALDLILLGVGCTIGTGIFVLTGVAAAEHAGPGIALSYLLSGIVCMFAGLAYTELASTVPISGSAYTYSYAVLGEFVAWLVACGLVLEYTVAASTVSAGWSGYFVGILKQGGIELPEKFTTVPSQGGIVNLPAICIALFVGLLLYRGTRESIIVNRILVGLKLIVIFIFLIVATPEIKMENYAEFLPFGWHGVLTGAAAIFFAYLGFDAVATTAEECKNPRRDLPIGIIGGLAICAVLYVAVSLVLTGISHYSTLSNAEPMARALRENGSNIGSALVGTGAVAGMVTVLLVMMYAQTRIFVAMSRDGLIPSFFGKLHEKYATPHISCIIVTLVVMLISGFTPIKTMGHMSSLGTLFAFCVVSIGVVALRLQRPDLHRTFRCPAVFFVAPIAVISCGYLILTLLSETYKPFFIWFAIGLVVYFAYSRKRSFLS
ncbi:MAG: amino acid permease [Alphaproteobacteria bacterium RIFCSPLOWO2_01_FULL_40_26]|nr:MAG: amino acid permease [Alphaproteobacteria bacterium RIFCSPHIGHO2_02_FULL_40_34]OFW86618.1 MAG: amino acid permease [Alphaproteobacteria bacterium RIFCSPHIGHO2_01_FULL_40_8]OFW95511.1 MAG: amino acid permease [Alphaproteobacteria bacterium RIFCSPLOWO2_01_FULL_40_26]OFX09336.1 MAG: amino acid permease [Alphaproteobacteria bacterium RIFCSPLOWO2_02_FULL_40_19]OFX10854.1 MAG: amino acid permease [Alphaproteobacteria bacterium RIFCSPLOWO2_12_FULL_40_11]